MFCIYATHTVDCKNRLAFSFSCCCCMLVTEFLDWVRFRSARAPSVIRMKEFLYKVLLL